MIIGPHVGVTGAGGLAGPSTLSFSDGLRLDGKKAPIQNSPGAASLGGSFLVTAPDTHLQTGLIGYFPFDESSGSFHSKVVNADLLVPQNSPDYVTPGFLGAGAVGMTNGSAQYLTAPAGYLQGATAGFTCMFWFKLKSNGSWQRLLDFGNGVTDYFAVAPASPANTCVVVTLHGGNTTFLNPDITGKMNTGVWHHLLFSCDNTTGYIYLDGSLLTSGSYASALPSVCGATTNNYLGRSQFVTDPYGDMILDEVGLWSRYMDAADYALLWGGGAGFAWPLAYFP